MEYLFIQLINDIGDSDFTVTFHHKKLE